MDNKNSNILIVDDEPRNLQLLGNILKKEKHNIAVASDGPQALHMVDKRKPDLVLLDITMPRMDGFEVCKQLKENGETKHIPVIFLTARLMKEDIVKGFQLGAADYVTKPFNTHELLARIHTHLQLKKSRDIILDQSREQKTLLHILCHDLSNPFHCMIAMAGALDIINDLDELKEMMGHLNKAARNGNEIIELVRKMEALEDNRLPMELQPISLSEAVWDSVEMLTQKFRDKNILPNVHIENDAIVIAERVSLVNTVINNLLTNAVKFSEPGSRIDIKALRKNGKITFTVQDYGIGMSESLANSVFDIGKITTRPGTAGEEGTGFGMPLVKKFVTFYGGTIGISSREKAENDENGECGTLVRIVFNTPLNRLVTAPAPAPCQ